MQPIPEQIKKLALSSELYDKSEKIGNDFGLHVDQTGELDAEIRDVLQGFSKSSDFVQDIMQRLEIDRGMAEQIAKAVNTEVFDTLKNLIKSPEQNLDVMTRQSGVSALERAGNFSVEKEKPQESNGNGVTSADRDKILEGLENPQSRTGDAPANLPTGDFNANPKQAPENHTEPLVDYLLSNSVGQGEKKIVVETKNTVMQEKTAGITPQRQRPDPYREAIK